MPKKVERCPAFFAWCIAIGKECPLCSLVF